MFDVIVIGAGPSGMMAKNSFFPEAIDAISRITALMRKILYRIFHPQENF